MITTGIKKEKCRLRMGEIILFHKNYHYKGEGDGLKVIQWKEVKEYRISIVLRFLTIGVTTLDTWLC